MAECQFQRSQHRLYQSHRVKYLVAKVLVWDPSSTRPATPGLPVKVIPRALSSAQQRCNTHAVRGQRCARRATPEG